MGTDADKKIAKAQVLAQAFITLGSIITAFGTLIFVTMLVEGAETMNQKLSELVGIAPSGYGIGTMVMGLVLILIGIFLPWRMIEKA